MTLSVYFLCMWAESAPPSWEPRLYQHAPSPNCGSSHPVSTISQQPSGLDAFIIPILQTRKLRPKEVNSLKKPPASQRWGWDANFRPSEYRAGFTLLCHPRDPGPSGHVCALPSSHPLMTSAHDRSSTRIQLHSRLGAAR